MAESFFVVCEIGERLHFNAPGTRCGTFHTSLLLQLQNKITTQLYISSLANKSLIASAIQSVLFYKLFVQNMCILTSLMCDLKMTPGVVTEFGNYLVVWIAGYWYNSFVACKCKCNEICTRHPSLCSDFANGWNAPHLLAGAIDPLNICSCVDTIWRCCTRCPGIEFFVRNLYSTKSSTAQFVWSYRLFRRNRVLCQASRILTRLEKQSDQVAAGRKIRHRCFMLLNDVLSTVEASNKAPLQTDSQFESKTTKAWSMRGQWCGSLRRRCCNLSCTMFVEGRRLLGRKTIEHLVGWEMESLLRVRGSKVLSQFRQICRVLSWNWQHVPFDYGVSTIRRNKMKWFPHVLTLRTASGFGFIFTDRSFLERNVPSKWEILALGVQPFTL